MQTILLIIDKITKAMANKHFSCGIFLDLSKAFDTVRRPFNFKNNLDSTCVLIGLQVCLYSAMKHENDVSNVV